MAEYRCTRNQPYGPGCPGYDNPRARQGHYITACCPENARQQMKERFPEDTEGFTCDLWKETP
jgi:hypothetical protein